MTFNKSGVVLLLTATIDPGKTPLVARLDPETRMGDYQTALMHWLQISSMDRIVFCENSGYDLTPLRGIAGARNSHRVEFLSFSGNQGGMLKGKGYSELGIIEHALSHSTFLPDAEFIIKCTGRLTVSNAEQLLPAMAQVKFDVMCNLTKYLSFADSRLFVSTPDFLADHLLPMREIVSDLDGVFFEHALSCASASAIANRKRWRPFPIYPHIKGISGTYGNETTEGIVKKSAKRVFHRARNYLFAK